MPLLDVSGLSVVYAATGRAVPALEAVSVALKKGDSLGIIGESGSGKTTFALAVMGLISGRDRVEGRVSFGGTDLLSLKESQRQSYRWKKIAMVFQNSLEVLNPVLSVGEQVAEPLMRHLRLNDGELQDRADELLCLVGMDPIWKAAYPHQLSGGMRQRVLLAMALSCRPELLLVDEPTTSLDPMARREIIDLLQRLQKEHGFTLVLISHDLACVSRLTKNLLVLYDGGAVEMGETAAILEDPYHPYTRGLINASPSYFPFRDLWGIPGEPPAGETAGCAFCSRCVQCVQECHVRTPLLREVSGGRRVACGRGGIVTLLEARGLRKEYRLSKGVVCALDGVDLRIKHGEVLGLVGETGSGKSTVAQILGGIVKPSEGRVVFQGNDINSELTRRERGVQLVMQDPFSATSHRFTVRQTLREPLDINRVGNRDDREHRIIDALARLQLPTDDRFLDRRCFELSGGQRQRLAIARALVMKPVLLLADEITSFLDPSTQANLLRLLKGLQNEQGFAMLFITHDLDLGRKVADRIVVMHRGVVVEQGSAHRIFTQPCSCHTRDLVAVAPE